MVVLKRMYCGNNTPDWGIGMIYVSFCSVNISSFSADILNLIMKSCASAIASIPKFKANGCDAMWCFLIGWYVIYIIYLRLYIVCCTQINNNDRFYYLNIQALLKIMKSLGTHQFIPHIQCVVNATMIHQKPVIKKPTSNKYASKETRLLLVLLHRYMHYLSPNLIMIKSYLWMRGWVVESRLRQRRLSNLYGQSSHSRWLCVVESPTLDCSINIS